MEERRNARWAGVFYVLATAAPISALPFIGFLGGGLADEPDPDYLTIAATSRGQMVVGMLVELVGALAVVGIICTLLPILRRRDEALALGFSNLRFIEALGIAAHATIVLALVTLSEEQGSASTPIEPSVVAVAELLLSAREWIFLVGSGIVWSLSALILNYLLYQHRLVPRWLSLWGLVGAALSLGNYMPQFFAQRSYEIAFLPIAVQEMVFAVWLIVKGFGSTRLADGTGE